MGENYLLPMPIEEVEEAEEPPSLTYRLDFDAGRIVGKVDGLAAVNQAIKKAVITPRFKCLIYDDQYGNEAEGVLTADDATPDYVSSAIEGFVKDALSTDTRILDVYDFSFTFENDVAYIRFKADTIFGETEVEEVV